MRRNATLINIACGKLVDEKELVIVLQSRHLSAVGLDVFIEEPPSFENPLVSLPQTLITLASASLLDRLPNPRQRVDSNEGSIETVKNCYQAISRPLTRRERMNEHDAPSDMLAILQANWQSEMEDHAIYKMALALAERDVNRFDQHAYCKLVCMETDICRLNVLPRQRSINWQPPLNSDVIEG